MDLTVGIVVGPTTDRDTLARCLYSIAYRVEEYKHNVEVITIGSQSDLIRNIVKEVPELWTLQKNIQHLDFDETMKKAWITKKKNLIVENASYENIILMHDYYQISPSFFRLLNNVSSKFDILQPRVINLEGVRHSDWLVMPEYLDAVMTPEMSRQHMKIAPNENGPRWICGLPYSEDGLKHLQYISGGFIMAKTQVLRDVPLDENLVWGEAEDVEWSRRLHENQIDFTMNENLYAIASKPGKWHLFQMPEETIEILKREFCDK